MKLALKFKNSELVFSMLALQTPTFLHCSGKRNHRGLPLHTEGHPEHWHQRHSAFCSWKPPSSTHWFEGHTVPRWRLHPRYTSPPLLGPKARNSVTVTHQAHIVHMCLLQITPLHFSSLNPVASSLSLSFWGLQLEGRIWFSRGLTYTWK